MLKSALNYFTSESADANAGFSDEHSSPSSDNIIGSIVDVGGTGVAVKKRIGEGGFAFVYSVVEQQSGKKFALKRLLAVDLEKKNQIIQEITFLKNLKSCPNILRFERAANLRCGLSATKCEEFLVLTELCVGSLYDCLSNRNSAYPAVTVARILFQTLEAVGFMHAASPPISHRDLKIENLLISTDGKIKLCDFGSATTKTYNPDHTWNMQMRTAMEEEISKFTTPMYRAPEMVDEWSNYPVNIASDIWALGCLLFQLCFHTHPFEDGAKLGIINANYTIPETDSTHTAFHDLIRQMLAVDPTWRPSCKQIKEHLGEVGVRNGWDLEGKIDFEIQRIIENSVAAVEAAKPNIDEHHQQHQHQHHSNPIVNTSSASATTHHLISSFRGGAGNMLGRIRESSKAVVSSLLAPKDLDFHLLTGKIAAMSFPSDGLDMTYKNQIEDVRQIMEARHADHYAVINLSERKYVHSRFTRGTVIDANWTTIVTPSVEQVLDATMKGLEFLGQHKMNVIVIHCLDGKSNSAMLFAAILVVCKVFTKCNDALNLFELKRCEPILSFGQRSVLKQLEKLVKLGPQINITLHTISITSVILEPIPLFTKANDGVRPFVEIYSNGQLVGTTFKDYNSLKLFTSYDGEVVLKTDNVKVPYGDVTVIVYHGRQSMGAFFGSKMEKVKICQVYFNPAYISNTRSYVRFPTHELDNIGDLERIPGDFSVSVNFARKDSKSHKFPYLLPERRKLDLVFQNRSEFEEAMETTIVEESSSVTSTNHSQGTTNIESPAEFQQPQRPPRGVKRDSPLLDIMGGHPEEKEKPQDMPKPSSLLDIMGHMHHEKREHHQHMPKPSSLVDIAGTNAKRIEVSNLIGEQKKTSSLLDFGQSDEKHENEMNEQREEIIKPFSNKNKTLLDFENNNKKSDDVQLLNVGSASTPTGRNDDLSDILGGFSAPPPAVSSSSTGPRVPQPGSQKHSPIVEDLFNTSLGGVGTSDLLAPTVAPPKQNSNLLGDFGNSPSMSTSNKLVDDMLSKLELNEQVPPQSQQPQNRPNYNSSFFQSTQNPNNTNGSNSSVPPSKANFADLLGGFAPTSENSNRTIGEMKKEVDKKYMDPEQAAIFEWTHGKSRNLRALLCSLDTVIWSGSRWNKCGMHQLVTHADVKKMYRKACLAVHPDKQSGTDNEQLSKLIFTELNDGWSKFQEDEPA